MDHKLNIKFGEINNLSDARYAAGMGVAFMGFNLSPSHPKYITVAQLKEISGWAPGPALVTEWENEPAEVIADTCNELGIEYVQLNSFNPSVTAALKPNFCVIQNIEIHAETHTGELINQLNQVNGLAMYYMLSFKSTSAQENFLSKPGNCLLIKDLCRDQPVLLNFYFDKANIMGSIEEFNPFGINLKGEGETKPGFQDFSGLNDLFDLIEKGRE